MTVNNAHETLGTRLTRARESLGLSYAAMGIKLGLDGSTVWNIERGKHVKMETVVQIASKLREPVNDWLRLAGYEPIEPTLDEALLATARAVGAGEESAVRGALGKLTAQDRARLRELFGEDAGE